MIEIQLVQGAKVWTAYLNPQKISLVEALNQSKSPLTQKARILVDGVWLVTDETVQQVLDLIK